MRSVKIMLSVLALGTLALAQAAPATSPSGCKLAPAASVAKRPSQPGSAETQLNGKTVRIDYSRPKIADPQTGAKRKIIGGTPVPFNQVWRLGANEATALHTETDLDINGTSVPAGNYTLFAMVTPDKWTLIVSKKTCEWGIPYPGEQEDFARIPMKLAVTQSTVDPFTIEFVKRSNTEATLNFAWENTKASVDVKAK